MTTQANKSNQTRNKIVKTLRANPAMSFEKVGEMFGYTAYQVDLIYRHAVKTGKL
jgi:hypothetical protein